jgi:hypothetical protein
MDSSIHAPHVIEPEFLVDDAKRHIILSSGSNGMATKFDQLAQHFLIDVFTRNFIFVEVLC